MNPCLGADGLYGVAFYPALPVKSISAEQHVRRNVTLERYRKEEALLSETLNRAHSETTPSDGLAIGVGGESEPTTSARDLVPIVQGPNSNNNNNSPPGDVSTSNVQVTTKEQEEEPVFTAALSPSTSSSSDAEGTHENPITSRHAKLYDGHGAIEMPIVREFTDNVCPGYSQLLPHSPENPFTNILLIVAMTAMRYEMIPMFEVVYREHFRNILYCGSPHDSIEIFLRKYQLSEDRSFSFLPIHSKYTYECLLGALEMGYNVDGWIMTTDDALINTWNLHQMNFSKLWYSGDHSIQVTGANWKTLDPGSQKLPRSLDGVQKVLEFLKSSLIGSVLPDDITSISAGGLAPLEHQIGQSRITKREAEIPTRSPFIEKSFLEKVDLRNQTDDSAFGEAQSSVLPDSAASKIPRTPFNLHTNAGRLVFDVIEIKSVSDSLQTDKPNAKNLSNLNYVVEANQNETAKIDSPKPQDDLIDHVRHADVSEIGQVIVQANTSRVTTQVDDAGFLLGDLDEGTVLDMAIEQVINNPTNTAEDKDLEIDTVELTSINSEEEISSSIEDENEAETERPISEVLRKLLVATRNTTNQEQADLDEPALETFKNNSASMNSTTATNLTEINLPDTNPSATPEIEITIITEEIVPVEKSEQGEKSKASSGTRENPVIDLFLHPVNVTSEHSLPVEKSLPVAQSPADSPVVYSETVNAENKGAIAVKPEVGHDSLAEIDVHEIAVVFSPISNETSVPSLTDQGGSVDNVTISNLTTTVPSTSTTTEPTFVSTPGEEERKNNADTLHIEDTLSTLKELYTLIKENLGVPSDDSDVISYADTAFYGGDRGYRLNPKLIHHFRCEKGTNLEFCKVSSEFLYQLSENTGKDFRLVYDKVPMYYIPKRDQLKFYLLSNLMLQHGVTDEIAIPLILSGLGPERDWVQLEKSHFGGLKGRNGESTSTKYPLFNSGAAVLYPIDLNTVTTDPKLQKVFCLKYLLRLLQH